MEVKKQPQATASAKNYSLKKVQSYVADVKSEIQKITWTSRDELQVYTKIVVVATFIFGMSIYFLDLLIQGTLSGLNYLLYLIAG